MQGIGIKTSLILVTGRIILMVVKRNYKEFNKKKSEIEYENENFKKKVVDANNLNKRIETHLILFVNLFVEIEALRTKLIEKDKELETLKKFTLY